MFKFASTVIALVLLAAAAPAPAEPAPDARAVIEKEVARILTHLKDPAFKALAREAQVEKIRGIINSVFDYGELSKRTLGRDWKKFSPEQLAEFEQLFGKLLENTYADRVLGYTSERIEFGKQVDRGQGKVEVESTIFTDDGKEIPVFYRMVLNDGRWSVYDVVIEGISLVQNYRSQFREILHQQSPADLLEKLRGKVQP